MLCVDCLKQQVESENSSVFLAKKCHFFSWSMLFILSPKLLIQLLLIILCMCVYSSVWPDKFQSQLPLIVLVVILSLDAS